MKKKILALGVIVIALAILASGTIAYFTAEDTARNVITSGGVDIALHEWQKEGANLVPYPDEPIEIAPGSVVSKIAEVENLDADAWIRAKLEITVTDRNEQVMGLNEEELAKIISLDLDRDHWIEQDGWFYYNQALKIGESTEPIFTQVTFSGPGMKNQYQKANLEITVIAQGVQMANNGDNALEAAGWPEE